MPIITIPGLKIRKRTSQCQKPRGALGRFVLWSMNKRHSGVTDWGLQHIAIHERDVILDVGCGVRSRHCGRDTLLVGGHRRRHARMQARVEAGRPHARHRRVLRRWPSHEVRGPARALHQDGHHDHRSTSPCLPTPASRLFRSTRIWRKAGSAYSALRPERVLFYSLIR
jgi:hypothetical protein